MWRSRLAPPLLGAALVIAGCGNGGGDGGDVTLSYVLWDSNQLPPYSECAEAFREQTGVAVDIEQFSWNDYWNNLTTQFGAGRAPDVFTNHLAFYPQFVADEVILPIDEQVAADGVDLEVYLPGLADLWVGQDGNRYGLPKDWDTVALVYNEAFLADAGLTADDVWDATWNPDDGGSFEEVIASLTVDENGVRGNEPGFDPAQVAVYGLGYDDPSAQASGQTSWGNFARTLGFDFLADQNPWGVDYQFDDPRLASTLDWFQRMIEAGYAAKLEDVQGIGQTPLFEAGQLALSIEGSWMISTYTGADLDVGFAPLPAGPEGRWSMYNGLADSITAGTDHPEEAWEWVKFLASAECQQIVAEHAVVFPAIQEAAELAEQSHLDNGVDVSAYTVYLEEETTFLHPVTANYSQINAAVGAAVEEILLSQREAAEALTDAQQQVSQIMG